MLDLAERVNAHGEALSLIVEALRELVRERTAQQSGLPIPGQMASY